MSPDKLVYMANQIGKYFETQHGQDPVIGIADHLKKYWDPSMRRQMLVHLAEGGAGLDPTVLKAVRTLAS